MFCVNLILPSHTQSRAPGQCCSHIAATTRVRPPYSSFTSVAFFPKKQIGQRTRREKPAAAQRLALRARPGHRSAARLPDCPVRTPYGPPRCQRSATALLLPVVPSVWLSQAARVLGSCCFTAAGKVPHWPNRPVMSSPSSVFYIGRREGSWGSSTGLALLPIPTPVLGCHPNLRLLVKIHFDPHQFGIYFLESTYTYMNIQSRYLFSPADQPKWLYIHDE